MHLRVMTYNIRLGIDSSIAAIAEAIRREGIPDILALQEVGQNWQMGECIDQTSSLAESLGLHGYFAGALTDSNNGRFGISLLSRLPIEHTEIIQLPRIEDEQRVMLKVRLTATHPITVLTSHFSIAEKERCLQADLLARTVESCDGAVVALGDFNARPATSEYETLTATLDDCFAHNGSGPAETFSVANPHRQIDYIMVANGARPAGLCTVLRSVITSDHFPLLAEIVL